MRLLIALLFVAAPLRAGVIYDFTTTVETPRFAMHQSGHMSVEGQNYRADFPGRDAQDVDIVISNDGDQSAIYVNLKKCAWTYRARVGPTRSSAFFHLPSEGGDAVIGEPHVTHRLDGTETIQGYAATKHVIDIAYRLVGVLADTAVRGIVTARATVWTIDALPPLPMRRDLRTGHESIDKRLDAITSELRGMIVRHELEVTRAFEGGVAQTEKTVTTVQNLRVAELPQSLFAPPDEAAYAARSF